MTPATGLALLLLNRMHLDREPAAPSSEPSPSLRRHTRAQPSSSSSSSPSPHGFASRASSPGISTDRSSGGAERQIRLDVRLRFTFLRLALLLFVISMSKADAFAFGLSALSHRGRGSRRGSVLVPSQGGTCVDEVNTGRYVPSCADRQCPVLPSLSSSTSNVVVGHDFD